MSEPAIAREVAEGMVADWAATLGAELAPESERAVVRLVMAGRIDFDGDAFTVRLAAPLKLENGETIAALKLAEPTAGQLRDAAKGKRDDIDTALRLISALSGQPVGVVERIKERDFLAVSEVLGFFG